MSYEEEDTCMSYEEDREEEDTCCFLTASVVWGLGFRVLGIYIYIYIYIHIYI